MTVGEVGLDAGDEVPGVMLHPATGRALEMKLLVGMCQLPVNRFVGAEV